MRRYLTITSLTSLLVVAVTILAAVTPARAATPPQSAFFSTAALESYSTYQMSGDGDLWPSCWADDDNLYAANGDGTAFTSSPTRYDMAVSRIGAPRPTSLEQRWLRTWGRTTAAPATIVSQRAWFAWAMRCISPFRT